MKWKCFIIFSISFHFALYRGQGRMHTLKTSIALQKSIPLKLGTDNPPSSLLNCSVFIFHSWPLASPEVWDFKHDASSHVFCWPFGSRVVAPLCPKGECLLVSLSQEYVRDCEEIWRKMKDLNEKSKEGFHMTHDGKESARTHAPTQLLTHPLTHSQEQWWLSFLTSNGCVA